LNMESDQTFSVKYVQMYSTGENIK
jgi:hypothetical protein